MEVALEDLTELFHCTERNVKLIIRKLQEEELIEWHPGRAAATAPGSFSASAGPLFFCNWRKLWRKRGNTGRRLNSSISAKRISRWWNSLFYG
ncbi:hypothetical protein HMSSN036_41520 [Paenibacillus macerans]|nr:hypothetical protein HMSSN036_41520 [Paenibacillus macerans]